MRMKHHRRSPEAVGPPGSQPGHLSLELRPGVADLEPTALAAVDLCTRPTPPHDTT